MHRVVVVSVVLLSGLSCAGRVVSVPNSMPAAVQLETLRLSRLWVAGFVANHSPEFDVSTETVRLLRAELRKRSLAQIVEAEPLSLDSEAWLADTAFWRGVGQEHGSPLIVSGSVKLLFAPPAIEQRGRRTVYLATAGRVLEATIVLIDGRTGDVVSREELPSQMRYSPGGAASGLALYFQLMDRAMPDFFRAIAGGRPSRQVP